MKHASNNFPFIKFLFRPTKNTLKKTQKKKKKRKGLSKNIYISLSLSLVYFLPFLLDVLEPSSHRKHILWFFEDDLFHLHTRKGKNHVRKEEQSRAEKRNGEKGKGKGKERERWQGINILTHFVILPLSIVEISIFESHIRISINFPFFPFSYTQQKVRTRK